MDFEAREDRDGVRLSWSALPKSKIQHQRNVIPMGALYTPLNNKSTVPVLDQNCIINCRTCRSILNPFASYNNGLWTCQFCSTSNQAPPMYDEAGQPHLPPSLSPDLTTVEYQTGRKRLLPPVFFYVVDTIFENDDIESAFQQLKESLIISLSLLPEDALVGFISYGKHVKIHDLGSNDNISYTFNGNKQYTLEQLQSSLGLISSGLSIAGLKQSNEGGYDQLIGNVGKRFLQPVNIAEYQLTNIIENLVVDSFPRSEYSERPERATGAAINIAALLLKTVLGGQHQATGGHLMVFISGVCTYGPGKIVHKLLKEPLRSHHDIIKAQTTTIQAPTTSQVAKSDAALFKQAKKFYQEITKHFVTLGLSCDFFIGSYDQVGFYEMDEVCCKTGGSVVLSDSFSTAIFKQSFIKFFKKQEEEDDENEHGEYLDMGFNATLEVKTCTDLKVEGLVGNATSLPLNKTVPANERMVSINEVGEGKTNSWKLCNANPQSTYALFFEKLDSSHMNTSTSLQLLFHYEHPCGEMRLRVTTVPISIIADSDAVNLEAGFDQEAATVLVARDAINKVKTGQIKSAKDSVITKKLDQTLIDFCSRFAVYTAGAMESFRLSSTFSLFPQFLYHLRRSPFINVFNSSPDETSFVRHIFMHEDTGNSLLMIQPTLLSYDINTWGSVVDETTGEAINEPEPVLLDSMSLGPSKILLLDTFFQILIYHGSQVAEWRKARYHEQEDYEYFKDFLEAPKKEAMVLLMDRFPLPRFIDCDEGGSQARFLMAKLNPSTSYAMNVNHFYGTGSRNDVFTDDVNLQSYMDHIQRVVVTSKK
ncbi:SEC23 Protein transport protein SEC23 [Candida maltosa Xu316]|uniref:Protein transport protein SEC23 n=1 Tax=Candida maltosa (strain Xu316) TaxID=1245528 RepID=M3JXK8_CANMX|nr:GTPase activating transport protein, putative [Candida maltosa Xu316]